MNNILIIPFYFQRQKMYAIMQCRTTREYIAVRKSISTCALKQSAGSPIISIPHGYLITDQIVEAPICGALRQLLLKALDRYFLNAEETSRIGREASFSLS